MNRLYWETLLDGTDEKAVHVLVPTAEVNVYALITRGTTLRNTELKDVQGSSQFLDYVFSRAEDARAGGNMWTRYTFVKNYDAQTPLLPVYTQTGSTDETWPDVLVDDIDYHFSLNLPMLIGEFYATERPLHSWKLKEGGTYKSGVTRRWYLSNSGNFTGVLRDDPQAVAGQIQLPYYGQNVTLHCLHKQIIVRARPATYVVSGGIVGSPNNDAGSDRLYTATNRTDWVSFTKPAMPQIKPEGVWLLVVDTVDPPVGAAIIKDIN